MGRLKTLNTGFGSTDIESNRMSGGVESTLEGIKSYESEISGSNTKRKEGEKTVFWRVSETERENIKTNRTNENIMESKDRRRDLESQGEADLSCSGNKKCSSKEANIGNAKNMQYGIWKRLGSEKDTHSCRNGKRKDGLNEENNEGGGYRNTEANERPQSDNHNIMYIQTQPDPLIPNPKILPFHKRNRNHRPLKLTVIIDSLLLIHL